MRNFTLIVFLLVAALAVAQGNRGNIITKKVAVRDSIQLDSVSINPTQFRVLDAFGNDVDSSFYNVDFSKALLKISESYTETRVTDSLTITYLPYPSFLTQKYFQFDPNIIVENTDDLNKLYQLNTKKKSATVFKPFEC